METEFRKLTPITPPPDQSALQAHSYEVEHDENRSRKLACGLDPLDESPKDDLEWFKPEIQPTPEAQKQAAQLKNAIRQWVDGGDLKFLTIIGGTGVGKSELAKAAVWKLTPEWHDRHSYYITAAEFDKRVKDFDNAKNLAGAVSVEPDVWVERLAAAEHLVIDDIGAGYIDKGWTRGRLERLVDLRYRYKLPTIVISNLAPSNLTKELGERTYSRLSDTSLGKILILDKLADVRKIAK
jgi:DNA replication protein DnaC